MKSTRLTAKSLVLGTALVFGSVAAGLVHSQQRERDLPDAISPADSDARDSYVPGKDKSIKERLHMKEGKTTQKQDNSRYSTDGTERYESGKSGQDVGGTGPKREGRY